MKSSVIRRCITPTISLLRGQPLSSHLTEYSFSGKRRTIFSAMKHFWDRDEITKSANEKKDEIDKRADVKSDEISKLRPEGIFGEKVLYRGDSAFTIRAMFAGGAINTFYWTYHLVSCIAYEGVVINGIDFGGQSSISIFGYIGAGLIFYCSREYSNHTACMVYETPDGSRIGFQMYNMMGAPGRKIEVDVGNARLANTVQYNLASDSYIPLRLEGVAKNVLVEKQGFFYYNGRLKELLQAGGNGDPLTKRKLKKQVVVLTNRPRESFKKSDRHKRKSSGRADVAM